MKNLTNQIIIFIFLFLSPSISFSQTFKCEFVTEKFKGGKSNTGNCSGDPEIVFSVGVSQKPRTEHCEVDDNTFFEDYYDYIVSIDDRTITYTEKSGKVTSMGKGLMIKHSYNILSTKPFIQYVSEGGKRNPSISYLITYLQSFPKQPSTDENVFTIYIPHHGKSIISTYITNSGFTHNRGFSSWIKMKFGKCVNTSK
jgi:hypothetical protein